MQYGVWNMEGVNDLHGDNSFYYKGWKYIILILDGEDGILEERMTISDIYWTPQTYRGIVTVLCPMSIVAPRPCCHWSTDDHYHYHYQYDHHLILGEGDEALQLNAPGDPGVRHGLHSEVAAITLNFIQLSDKNNGYKSTFPWISKLCRLLRKGNKSLSTFVVVENDKTILSVICAYLAWRGLKMNSKEMTWLGDSKGISKLSQIQLILQGKVY